MAAVHAPRFRRARSWPAAGSAASPAQAANPLTAPVPTSGQAQPSSLAAQHRRSRRHRPLREWRRPRGRGPCHHPRRPRRTSLPAPAAPANASAPHAATRVGKGRAPRSGHARQTQARLCPYSVPRPAGSASLTMPPPCCNQSLTRGLTSLTGHRCPTTSPRGSTCGLRTARAQTRSHGCSNHLPQPQSREERAARGLRIRSRQRSTWPGPGTRPRCSPPKRTCRMRQAKCQAGCAVPCSG